MSRAPGRGKARSSVRSVTRDELLRDVWGQSFGGSNVVDAVVRTLRKKPRALGPAVETIIGHGYRFSGFSVP
jgi:DNA-binding response OmpR family regulator